MHVESKSLAKRDKKFKALAQNKQGRKQENDAVFHFLSIMNDAVLSLFFLLSERHTNREQGTNTSYSGDM